MALILRKCQENGFSSNNFYYGKAGEIATAPDWDPKPECGNGLHGLLEGNGNWSLLVGFSWLVIEAKTEDIVEIDDQKCKFRTGKILFHGSTEELRNSEFPRMFNNLNSSAAYNWARSIGNNDIMMHKITDSEYALYWGTNIGNKDVMVQKINSEYAYLWARNVGNRDVMMDKINNSYDAYYWAVNIGNHDVMMHKITDSYWAYQWALDIGNHDVMKSKVTNPKHISCWNVSFPNNKISIFKKLYYSILEKFDE